MRPLLNELNAGRQFGQHSDRKGQNTHQPRLPKQTERRVIDAVSEVLCKPARAGSRKRTSDESSRRGFRPESGAEAFLVLEKDMYSKAAPKIGLQARELAARPRGCRRQEPISHNPVVSSLVSSRSRIAQRVRTSPDNNQVYAVRPVAPETQPVMGHPVAHSAVKRARGGNVLHPIRTDETPDRPRRDALRARIPGNDSNFYTNKVPRGSKTLPALPSECFSDCTTSITQLHCPADVFQKNKDKVLRGQGSPILPNEPRLYSTSRDSSGSSLDSAEQTWNVINSLMNAVDEDEVKKLRMALLRNKDRNADKDGWSTTFPRSAASRSTRKRFSSSEQEAKDVLDDMFDLSPSRLQSPSRPLTRCSSTASIFSIVIQPTSHIPFPGVSEEPQPAHVPEENLPTRIRRIMEMRGHRDTPPISTSYAPSPFEVHYHGDLLLTLEALRDTGNNELDDITFNDEDT